MKKIFALTVLAASMAAPAFAQSSVTVYGRLNLTAERQKTDAGSVTNLTNNSSRIGFKGTEDLGGGLKAFFLIEHGFSPDTGAAASTFWGRESNVGLEGAFGKVRLGNMGPTNAYFTTADYISMHNHDTGTSSDAFYAYPGNAKNMIAYTSPSLSGLVIDAQFGLKEASATKNTVVLTGNYDAGPLHLGGTYLTGPGEAKEFGLRGLYELGAITVGAYYIHNEADVASVTVKRDIYRVSGMYALGASEFHVNVGAAGKAKALGIAADGSSATQYTLGYNYNLSKRTKLYGYYTKVNDGNLGAYGGDFSSIAAGIRHNF
ncbi:porin [Ideonella margarita]|uniref:Porin n=1 Tax=Ideonella margarita TaxID=2984191 RepID=A0ABU9C5J4_9BURK